MKEHIFEFDINKVEFEEAFKNNIYETVTMYFIAPKEWLGDGYPEAVFSALSVEHPIAHPEAIYARVMMSPAKEDGEGCYLDYDWFDIILLSSEVEQLMDLARRKEVQ